MRFMRFPVAFALCLPMVAQAATPVDYEKQVRPLLAAKCHACHGDEVQQSGLRLDKRQNAMRGGDYGPVIIPGKSAESKLIRRVINGDGGLQMPPTGALSKEEIALLRQWIDEGADFRMELKEQAPPAPVDPKTTAFLTTVRSGSPKDVEKLLAANPELLTAKDRTGSTALHHAAAFAPLATVKLLLDKGADVNAKNRRASTPLHWAIRDEAKVRLLLEHGAAVNAKQADGRTPLYNAASLANPDAIVKLLLDKGADVSIATANGQTPLMAVAARGNTEAMRLMLEKKADVNATSGTGATALMAAAGSRNPLAVKMLLAKGADVNALTKKSESALASAATAGVDEVVKLLLDAGATVNVADDRGYTALMYGAANEPLSSGIVRMLLAKGADPKATGEGETARSLAAKRGDSELARLLGVTPAEAKQATVAPLPDKTQQRSIPASVTKALALLENQSHNFIRIAGCNSCHAQDLPSTAAAVARDRGIPAPKAIEQITESMNGETAERILDLVAAGVPSLGWEMMDRGLNHTPRDEYTDAVVYFMKANLSPEGYWKSPEGRRPPMNAGDMQATALAVYTLKTFAPEADRADTAKTLARVAVWLGKARPVTTQERAFHLMGLAWSGATQAFVDSAARALAASQHTDGGWSQFPANGSDAYASGQALYALNIAGKMAVANVVYQKGVQYLLRSQADDGSWHVKTRSIWIQPYFDSGFPYQNDQWISAAGTAWASMALSLAADSSPVQVRAGLQR
jgi:ankyrin repeat protein